MIVDFFINLLKSLIGLLPSIPEGISLSFGGIYYVFNVVNYYVPISELFTAVGIYIVVINFKLGFNIVKWLGERIVI